MKYKKEENHLNCVLFVLRGNIRGNKYHKIPEFGHQDMRGVPGTRFLTLCLHFSCHFRSVQRLGVQPSGTPSLSVTEAFIRAMTAFGSLLDARMLAPGSPNLCWLQGPSIFAGISLSSTSCICRSIDLVWLPLNLLISYCIWLPSTRIRWVPRNVPEFHLILQVLGVYIYTQMPRPRTLSRGSRRGIWV